MYTPREIIVQDRVLEHSITKHIVSRCPGAEIIVCPLGSETTDAEILRRYSKLYDPTLQISERKKLGRETIFLHGSDKVIATMASGRNPDKRCHNFKKITPYIGACLFNCEYCWFKDPDLMLRVNVTFFDRLADIEQVIQTEPPEYDVVFTFTHYKTDCLSIEHLTGFGRTLVGYFARQDRAFLLILTKSDAVDPLIGQEHNGHTIIQWSMNADHFTRKYEHGTASLKRKLLAAQRVNLAGYPVTFRVDPIFAFAGWQDHYATLVDTMYKYVRPNHVTLAVTKFQGPEEIRQIIENSCGHNSDLLRTESRKFVFAKTYASGSYDIASNPFEGTMADMPYTYPDDLRFELLDHIVSCFRRYDTSLSIGICEEPPWMWERLELGYSNHKNLDCACNFTAFTDGRRAYFLSGSR